MPVMPKPGITKISMPIRSRPRANRRMASQVIWPCNCECAQKNSTKQMAAMTPGRPTPGILSSSIRQVMATMMRIMLVHGSRRKSASPSSQSASATLTCEASSPSTV